MKCGLLGRKLGHSYSPQIHSMLADYSYDLFEVEPEELESFLTSEDFDGLNVTIPYKKSVIPFCAELSPKAQAIGSVNTIVRRKDGTLYGDNTDAFGFEWMLRKNHIDVTGKKVLVFGSGGASVMACYMLKKLGASEVIVVSRSGENNYDNLYLHSDADVIVNTTPLGMYPKTGEAPANLELFPKCSGVADVVYNPALTKLLLQAEQLGIPYAGGLSMLVAQAKQSSEQFQQTTISDDRILEIEMLLSRQMKNIILVGMPGCGKSTVAVVLAEKTGRQIIDLDEAIVSEAGCSIPEIFSKDGEAGFRKIESRVAEEAGKRSGLIISTGGGIVTREENYSALHQNGTIIWLQRDIDKLPTAGRPISQSTNLKELYAKRKEMYARFADDIVDNNGTLEQTIDKILEICV